MPSLSQTSFHQSMVTRLPNHWFAISFAIVNTTWSRCSMLVEPSWSSSATNRSNSLKAIRPQFSIASAGKSGMATRSSLPSG